MTVGLISEWESMRSKAAVKEGEGTWPRVQSREQKPPRYLRYRRNCSRLSWKVTFSVRFRCVSHRKRE